MSGQASIIFVILSLISSRFLKHPLGRGIWRSGGEFLIKKYEQGSGISYRGELTYMYICSDTCVVARLDQRCMFHQDLPPYLIHVCLSGHWDMSRMKLLATGARNTPQKRMI